MNNDNERPCKRRKKIFCIDLFMDFSTNTSLHGLKYLSERGISIIEKGFWSVTFVVSFILCFLLIHNVWTKWRTSPVIVSFSEQMIPVWKVPFPAVTICPQMKSRATVYNFTKILKQYWDTFHLNSNETIDLEMMGHIAILCYPGEFFEFNEENLCNHTMIDDIIHVAPEFSDIFTRCRWRGQDIECEELFERVLTSEGVCYNFNGIAASEMFRNNSVQTDYKYIETKKRAKGWSMSNGYIEGSHGEPYPKRGRENGARPDLDIMLQERLEDLDSMCNSINRGFKVYLHHPADVPRSSMYYYAVLPQQITNLAVGFRMISTSKRLKYYSPEIRQCYFPSDRKLRYFKEYTQNNCEAECRSNYTFQSCRCVGFNMPHNNSKEICSDKLKDCVGEAKDNLATHEMEMALQAEAGNMSGHACRCLPACDSVQYEAEVLKSQFDILKRQKSFESVFNYTMNKTHDYSRLVIFFKDAQFASMSRSELFGLTDFLANCGGLLGLFLGFSFLSLVEIFYFSSLRACCIKRRKRLEENNGATKDIESAINSNTSKNK